MSFGEHMTANEVLAALGYTKRRTGRGCVYEYARNEKIEFRGDVSELWDWLRETNQIWW